MIVEMGDDADLFPFLLYLDKFTYPLLFDYRSLELYVASDTYRPSKSLLVPCMIALDLNDDIIERL